MPLIRRVIANEQLFLYALAGVIGAAVGYAVFGFLESIALVQRLFFGSETEAYFSSVVSALPWWHVLAAPALGGLIIGAFVYWFMPDNRNHGVADVIEACALRGGRMDPKAGIGAVLAAACSIGAGASVGREGPAIHMGASFSAWIAERLQLTRSFSLTLVGCGVAGAVAASFNAPIAGVFFALEVVIGSYALSTFAPIVIGSVTATMVSRHLLGEAPAFFVPDYLLCHCWKCPYS